VDEIHTFQYIVYYNCNNEGHFVLQDEEVGVEGGITSVVCIRDELMLATTRGHVLRYRWDGSQNRDYCLDLRRVPFCIDQQVSKGYISFLWPIITILTRQSEEYSVTIRTLSGNVVYSNLGFSLSKIFSILFAFIEYWKIEDKEHEECCVICQPEYIIILILGFILLYEFGSEILL